MKRIITYIFLLTVCLFQGCTRPPQEAEAEAFACRPAGEERWTLATRTGDLLPLPDGGRTEPTPVVGGMYAVRGADSLLHLHTSDPHLKTKVSPRGFHRVGHFFDSMTIAQSTPLAPFEIIDRQGNTKATLPEDVVLMHGFRCGRALFYTRGGKYGYVDREGRPAIAPRWDYATDFHEGLALVGRADGSGRMAYRVITPDGRRCFDVNTQGALLGRGFACGLLDCYQPDTRTCFYLTTEGRTAFVLPDSIVAASPFRHGMAVVRTEGGAGLIDRQGRLLIAPVWDDARIVSARRILLRKDSLWHLARPDGQLLPHTDFEQLHTVVPDGFVVMRRRGERAFRLMDVQTAETSDTEFDTVVVTPSALQLEPEVFVRQPDGNGEADSVTLHPGTESHAQEVHPARESDVPRQVSYRAADWTQVKQDNPFYAEAVKVVSGRLEETDAERRRIILNYMEHLRTAYTTKDIDFLRQLFSERALIIVGTVVRASAREEKGYLTPRQVVYNVKSKQAYLSRLAELFKKNKKIDVQFSGFTIMRHPTVEGLYGVNLRQQYHSDIYSDDGYLFLLWDFRDPNAPQIHVRTWQPAFPDGHTPLEENDVLNISSFNLQ